jgi:hypothetical protein
VATQQSLEFIFMFTFIFIVFDVYISWQCACSTNNARWTLLGVCGPLSCLNVIDVTGIGQENGGTHKEPTAAGSWGSATDGNNR